MNQKIEHHEVRQQDVRRTIRDPAAFVFIFLAGVAIET
jgi:hypothetical protein